MSEAFSSMACRDDISACDTEKSFSAALAAFKDATCRSKSSCWNTERLNGEMPAFGRGGGKRTPTN